MKTYNIISITTCLFLLALLFSCNDDQKLIPDTNMSIEEEKHTVDNSIIIYPLSQKFNFSSTKSSGSVFETDWENFEEITLPNNEEIKFPWSLVHDANIPADMAKDIKKEDGWTMLLHTLTESAVNIGKYMIFYNQRTGIMKVFYYEPTGIKNNTAKWDLSFTGNQTWLNMGMDVAIPINLGTLQSWTCTNAIVGNAKGIAQGWNGFQIALAYDPNNSPIQEIVLMSESENVENYNFFGNTYAYSNGTMLTYGSTQATTPLNINVGTIFGGDAENYITNNVINESRGLSTEVIKKAAKIVGKLTGLLNKKPSVIKSDLEITTKGNFEVSGISTNMSTNASLGASFTEDKVGKLGSWNLLNQPTVYLSPLADYDPNYAASDLGERTYHLRGITKYDYDLVINPNLQSHVKNQWVEIDFVSYWLKAAYSGDVNYEEYLKEKKAFIPQVPDCYRDFGSVGTKGRGFQMTYYESDALSGGYQEGKGIFDFDFSNQRFLVRKPYQALIGYDAGVVFVPKAYTYDVTKVDIENLFMRVSLYTVTEFEGKEETTISTRTFIPKFEWDPDLYNEYKDLFPAMTFANSPEADNNKNPRPAIIYIDEQHPEGLVMEYFK